MKYKKDDCVHYKIVSCYKERSVEYIEVTGKIVDVHPKSKGYSILDDGYDTPIFVPERNILEVI